MFLLDQTKCLNSPISWISKGLQEQGKNVVMLPHVLEFPEPEPYLCG